MEELHCFIDGEWRVGEGRDFANVNPYTNEVITTVRSASEPQVREATRAVADGQRTVQTTPFERFELFLDASRMLAERRRSFVETIVTEAGFTVSDANGEVSRAVETLRLCGEEAKRLDGQVIPMEGAPNGAGRMAMSVRKPLGVVCAITPFNSPLNTVLHKVGPALASGNGVVLKPSAHTPGTGVLLVKLLVDSGFDARCIALLLGGGSDVGSWLLDDPVPAFYAFTGSTEVGELVRTSIGLRRSQLEMGSLSSTFVCDDADIEFAASRCVAGAFRKAGQICTSVQRLYIADSVFDDFVDAMVSDVSERGAGDPRDSESFIGPLIDSAAADRVERWVTEALGTGASEIVGGTRKGNVIEPTVIADADLSMKVMSQEIFGPVVCVNRFSELDAAIAEANDTPFGLAAGIFTSDLSTAFRAAQSLDMGSVHINESSNSRVDIMPYSGAKASGIGREGPRFAMEEMTQECVISWRLL